MKRTKRMSAFGRTMKAILRVHCAMRQKTEEEVGYMKRILIAFVAIIFLLAFSSLALAIDRAPKECGVDEKEEPVKLKEIEKTEVREGKAERIPAPEKESQKIKKLKEGEVGEEATEELPKRLQSPEKQKDSEKYDYFIDKNNNGIDDRQEGKSKETTSPRAIRPAPKDRQPRKPAPSIKKTGEKKKTRATSEEKEVKRERK
jgi:hypothetical protein